MSNIHLEQKDRLETIMYQVVLPAFISAYKEAERGGYDANTAFRANITESFVCLSKYPQAA